MTETTIKRKIARAIELKQIAAVIDQELDEIKTELVIEAEGRGEEHEPTEGGGWSWRHEDAEGHTVCVTQPTPKLKATLDPEAANFAKIKETAGRAWSLLFYQKPAWGLVDEFRVRCLANLDQPIAKKLIKLVTSASSIKVSFEVAKKEAS